MRTILIAGVMTAMLTGSAAEAQRVVRPGPGAGYPVPGPDPRASGANGYRPMQHSHGGPRWPMRDGRWSAGWSAPGGWNGYRRPYRGWALPGYWTQAGFGIADWSAYGLARPPAGYGWSRYYDDAVLIDGHGSVYDTVEGIDWTGGYDDRGYDDRGHDDRGYRGDRRDDGLGGAAIGAVAGGVAGNVIAGRGNRLGGTLIGAGVGAAAGYAIDRHEDRGRRVPPPPPRGYGADYLPPPPPPQWRSPDGRTIVTTTSAGGYYGGGTTTVVVQSAPVVTTTTTEVYEDAVTYSRPRRHRVAKRHWTPTKTICRCR